MKLEDKMWNRIPVLIAAAAALVFEMSPAHTAYIGNARWCAVVNIGSGNMEWDCEYESIETCRPHVIAGNRGFCDLNPYYSPAPPYGGRDAKRAHRHKHKD
jgi:hypothetical protein